LDHIQLSSDHESPHKKIKEVFVEQYNIDKEIKSELITWSLPHKDSVTPSSQIPTPSSKIYITYTSTKELKPSSLEPSDQSPTIEKFQKENSQLLQHLVE
jgi:hypothetical protein